MQKMKRFFQALKALEKILPDSTKRIFSVILTCEQVLNYAFGEALKISNVLDFIPKNDLDEANPL